MAAEDGPWGPAPPKLEGAALTFMSSWWAQLNPNAKVLAYFYTGFHPATLRSNNGEFAEVLWDTEWSVSTLPVSYLRPALRPVSSTEAPPRPAVPFQTSNASDGPQAGREQPPLGSSMSAREARGRGQEAETAANGLHYLQGFSASSESTRSLDDRRQSQASWQSSDDQIVAPMTLQGELPTEEELNSFADGWCLDENSRKFLAGLAPQVQAVVLTGFRASKSSRVKPLLHAFATSIARKICSQDEAELERTRHEFLVRWQMDEEAESFLMTFPPKVQFEVFIGFHPKENTPNIILLLKSFAKSIAEKIDGTRQSGSVTASATKHVSSSIGTAQPVKESSAESLQTAQAFLQKFNLSSTSADMLNRLSPECRSYVMKEFRPKQSTRCVDALLHGFAQSVAPVFGQTIQPVLPLPTPSIDPEPTQVTKKSASKASDNRPAAPAARKSGISARRGFAVLAEGDD